MLGLIFVKILITNCPQADQAPTQVAFVILERETEDYQEQVDNQELVGYQELVETVEIQDRIDC